MDQLLDSEDHIRQSNDRKADQRRDNRDRGDPIRLLELTELPVGHIRLSSNCSKTQPYDPSNQTPEEGRYAEEHEHGHHQQTRSPTGRVARLIIWFIIPRVRTEQVDDTPGRRSALGGLPRTLESRQYVHVPERMLRIVQLNIDSLVGPRWLERRQEIVAWLDELNADVVCLQEVWEDQRHPNTAGWIAEHAAGDWYWEFGGFAPPDPDAVGADPSLQVRIRDPEPMALRRRRRHELARRP